MYSSLAFHFKVSVKVQKKKKNKKKLIFVNLLCSSKNDVRNRKFLRGKKKFNMDPNKVSLRRKCQKNREIQKN